MADVAKLVIEIDIKNLKLATTELKKFGNAATTAASKTDKMTTSTSSFLKKASLFKTVGRDLSRYFTLPLVGAATASVKFAYDFNKSMGNVQALIPNTGDRIYELAEDVKTLGNETGVAFDDIADGLYRTISVFQDNIDTVERLDTAVKAGIAGYATTEEAVALLSAVTRAYGDTSAEAVDKVANLAFEAIRLGDTTFPALASAMQIATDRAVRLGISQEDLFATMATLTGVTGDAAMVATQFRSAMDSVLNPTDQMIELFKILNVESGKALIEQYGFIEAMRLIEEAAVNAGGSLRDFISRKEGVTLVSRLATQQLQDYNGKVEDIISNTDAFNNAYESVTKGIGEEARELDKLKNELKSVAIALGNDLLPTVLKWMKHISDIISSYNNLNDSQKELIISIGKVVAAVGPLLIAFGSMLKLFRLIKDLNMVVAFTKLGAVLGPTGAVIIGLGVVSGILKSIADTEPDMRYMLDNGTEGWSKYAEKVDDAKESLETIFRMMDEETGKEYILDPLTTSDGDPRYIAIGDLNVETISERISYISNEILSLEKEKSDLAKKTLDIRDDILKVLSSDTSKDALKGFDLFKGEYFQESNYSKLSKSLESREKLLNDIVTSKITLGGGKTAAGFQLDERGKKELRVFIADAEAQLAEVEEIILKSIEGKETLINAEAANLDSAIDEMGKKIADSELLKREYQSLLSGLTTSEGIGTGGASDGDKITTWQEWFAQVTGVDERLFSTGMQGAEKFLTDQAEELITAVAGDPDSLKSTLEERIDDMRKIRDELLFGIDDNLIDIPFTFKDDSIIAITEEIEALQTQVSEMSFEELLVSNQKAFDESAKSVNAMNEAYKAQQESVYQIISNAADEKVAIENRTGAYRNINSELEEYEAYLSLVQRTISEYSSAEGHNVDVLNSLYNVEDDILGVIKGINDETERRNKLIDIALSKNAEQVSSEETLFDRMAKESIAIKKLYGDFKTLDEELEFQQMLYDNVNSAFEEYVRLGDYTPEMIKMFIDSLEILDTAVKDVQDRITEAQIWETFTQGMEDLVNSGTLDLFNSTMDTIGASFVNGSFAVDSYADSLSNLAVTILDTASALLFQAGVQTIVANPALGLGLLVASGVAKIGSGALSQYMENQTSSSVTAYASGGVIDTPTYFPTSTGIGLAGEAGTEGLVPLTRTASGNLGVETTGSVNVNVYNNTDSQVTVQESDNGKMIDLIIERKVNEGFARGKFDGTMNRLYGARRMGAR